MGETGGKGGRVWVHRGKNRVLGLREGGQGTGVPRGEGYG